MEYDMISIVSELIDQTMVMLSSDSDFDFDSHLTLPHHPLSPLSRPFTPLEITHSNSRSGMTPSLSLRLESPFEIEFLIPLQIPVSVQPFHTRESTLIPQIFIHGSTQRAETASSSSTLLLANLFHAVSCATRFFFFLVFLALEKAIDL
jgi:hypothetical protein